MPVKKSKDQKLQTTTGQRVNTSTNMLFSLPERIIGYRPSKRVWIIILILGVLLLMFYKKEWFVAATVNGAPITNLEVLSRLNQQYRTNVLNQLVNEKIILDEAKKSNISISEQDINQRIQEFEKSVGGAQALDSLLSQQGQTRNGIRSQLRLQLIVEKLYENEATVSAQEIETFLKTEAQTLQSTDSATQRKEAEQVLKQQKISEIFNKKFTELRKNATVKIF